MSGVNIIADGLGSSLQKLLKCHKVVGDQICQFFECFLDGMILGFELVMTDGDSSFHTMHACSFHYAFKNGLFSRRISRRLFPGGFQFCRPSFHQWCHATTDKNSSKARHLSSK